MNTWKNLNFQDSASPLMEQILFFHDHSILILLMITISVLMVMKFMLSNYLTNRLLLNNQTVEIVWTIIPAMILMMIAIPSIRILYLMDEMVKPSMTLKTIGHQWYWSYEYSDFKKIEFDSFMLNEKMEGKSNKFRLLEVDNRTIIPMNMKIQMLVSAEDVIHSWTIPSLGVKIDGTPGRLNQTNFLINRPGVFFGQCSEICGTNHSFMPIVIESINLNKFIKWTNSF